MVEFGAIEIDSTVLELTSVDAYCTLTMAFQDATGLVAPSSVPEPATGTLLGIGLIPLAAKRRAS